MPHIAIRSRGAAAITLFVLSLACLGLEACGGSSSFIDHDKHRSGG